MCHQELGLFISLYNKTKEGTGGGAGKEKKNRGGGKETLANHRVKRCSEYGFLLKEEL